MRHTIHIKEIKTGNIHIDEQVGNWSDNAFIWTEGNFCCDCNRYLLFEHAGGNEPTDEEDDLNGYCGHERYRIRVTDNAGKVLYEEDGF